MYKTGVYNTCVSLGLKRVVSPFHSGSAILSKELSRRKSKMGKSSRLPPDEGCFVLPAHPDVTSEVEVVDTHTHILSTYEMYLNKYPPPNKHASLNSFVRDLLEGQSVKAVVDVWCEAPMTPGWREVVDDLSRLKQEGLSYHFVVGAHPHEAKDYDDQLEKTFKEVHQHPLCVGWGEIGLDYHYDNSPREVQQTVLRRQLRCAIKSGLGKAITIHTREADSDIERILKEELPKEQKIHVHCFTDSPELASNLLLHFPNLYIGITGVVTYASNANTANVIRQMASKAPPGSHELRIVLETDAPYMIPSTLPPPSAMGMKSGQKHPFSISPMIPFTADFITKVLNEARPENGIELWTTADVLKVARKNARDLYGI